jgi:hypothetical protein
MSKTAQLKAEREARKAKRAEEKLEKQRALQAAEAAAKEALMPPPQPRLLGSRADALLDGGARKYRTANTPEAEKHRATVSAQQVNAGNPRNVTRALQPGDDGIEG